jgi:hypothetical protein
VAEVRAGADGARWRCGLMRAIVAKLVVELGLGFIGVIVMSSGFRRVRGERRGTGGGAVVQ